jgi:exodeoxyribonuclease-3
MRIVSWNVNSVRARLPLVEKFTAEYEPDILCLQELKAQNSDVPVKKLSDMGYTIQFIHGMKGYNGMAILSRGPEITNRQIINHCDKDDRRHIAARVISDDHNYELHNVYVPAGGYEANPDLEPFAHKLSYVEELTRWFDDNRSSDDAMIMLGDLNIAPLETDVWNHKRMLKTVSHTPMETKRMEKLKESANWIDAMRHIIPPKEKLFTWWSYRAKDWRASDRGRRLDHIWVTPPLKSHIKDINVLKPARDWERPSDHVPVILDLK